MWCTCGSATAQYSAATRRCSRRRPRGLAACGRSPRRPPSSPQVIEMAPAWTLPMELRTKLHADAVRLTAAAKYKNAGTVEFLVDAEGRYYFIEVNPRIQVCSSDDV